MDPVDIVQAALKIQNYLLSYVVCLTAWWCVAASHLWGWGFILSSALSLHVIVRDI